MSDDNIPDYEKYFRFNKKYSYIFKNISDCYHSVDGNELFFSAASEWEERFRQISWNENVAELWP